MIEIEIPGHRRLNLKHLVLDYNGTLAFDGQVIEGVKTCMEAIGDRIQIHILTADTFGKARSRLKGFPCRVSILSATDQDLGKLSYVKHLGYECTACIGNGRNDRLMLKEAALGIAVILGEGAAVESLLAADIVSTDIVAALELFIHPLRLTATLRS
jgi:soluble P-type ATPase